MRLYQCAGCGWITVRGSIHGCVSCLSIRQPEPLDVVPAEQLQRVEEERDELRNMLIRVLDAVALLDRTPSTDAKD